MIELESPASFYLFGYIAATRARAEREGDVIRFELGPYPAMLESTTDHPSWGERDHIFSVDTGERPVSVLRKNVNGSYEFSWINEPTPTDIIALSMIILVD